jgi:hypothetical protein
VKLLDDGTDRDPLETHNFGNVAKYLFRPCQNEDGSIDEECTINFGSVAGTGRTRIQVQVVLLKLQQKFSRRINDVRIGNCT